VYEGAKVCRFPGVVTAFLNGPSNVFLAGFIAYGGRVETDPGNLHHLIPFQTGSGKYP
jgi:hypothetical protein